VEADGQLAHLDVLLTKNETGIESTTVHPRSSGHVGQPFSKILAG